MQRGSSLRHELLLGNLKDSEWYDVRLQTHASGEDLNLFYQGARGNFSAGEQEIVYELVLSEILPGEHLTIVYIVSQNSPAAKIGLLKLNERQYMLTNTVNDSLQKGQVYELDPQTKLLRFKTTTLPIIGPITLRHLHFDTPSPFHRMLDTALLPGFRRKRVASDIVPLYNLMAELSQSEISKEGMSALLNLMSQLGVSTFCSRILFDCLTKGKETA